MVKSDVNDVAEHENNSHFWWKPLIPDIWQIKKKIIENSRFFLKLEIPPRFFFLRKCFFLDIYYYCHNAQKGRL